MRRWFAGCFRRVTVGTTKVYRLLLNAENPFSTHPGERIFDYSSLHHTIDVSFGVVIPFHLIIALNITSRD